MAHGRSILLAFLAAAPIGCDTTAPKGAPAASASAVMAPAALVRFPVQPFGAAVFVVKAPPDAAGKDIKGIAKAFSGELWLDFQDLKRSRGNVAVDLATLETHGLGDDALDGDVTARVRDALEVGKATLKEPLRFARFTVRSVDEVSEENGSEPPGERRSVTLKVTGDLELHGVKQEKKVELTLTSTSAGGVVSQVTVKTAKPLSLSLSAHDIKPRGAKGEILAGQALVAAGAAHADEASVTFELSAKLGGAAAAPSAGTGPR